MLNRLEKGDEVSVVASSSFIENKSAHDEGIEILKAWGLKITHDDAVSRKHNYFAGNDEIRFTEIEIVFCVEAGEHFFTITDCLS